MSRIIYWLRHFRSTKVRDRYANCRFWHAGRAHAAWHAVVTPWHANCNLIGGGYEHD